MGLINRGITELQLSTEIITDGAYGEVEYYSNLPLASDRANDIYIVLKDSGVRFINKKYAGSYRSDGVNWTRLADLTNMLKSNDVINDLISTNADKPLSANQGKLLQDTKLENVIEDTTPQLGGDLDLNSNNITGTGNININGEITANLNLGNVFIGDSSNQAETRGLTLDDISQTATYKLLTTANKTKLDGIEAGATVDQTDLEIKTGYENNANTNAYTDTEKTKLSGIETGAEVNVQPDWTATSGDSQILNKPTTITTVEQTKLGYISLNQSIDLDSVLFNVGVNNLKISNATHTGDVTGSTTLTITDQAVTDAKLSHVATGTVKGRTATGEGVVEDLDIDTTLKSALNLTNADVGLSNVTNVDTTNANNISSGTLAEARLPSINADNITISNLEVDNFKSGVLDTDLTTVSSNDDTLASAKAIRTYVDNNFISSIADESVTNPKLAHISTSTVKGRLSANSGDVEDITVAALKTAMNFTKSDIGLDQVENVDVTRNWEQRNNRYIGTSRIRAVSSDGLELYSESVNSGLLVTDTGKVVASNDVQVIGSLSKGSGSFDIPHPDPKKTETHRLRHYFVETPSAGGNIYKYQIECVAGDNYIDLPDYYNYLNKDSLVWVNPVNHFGRAWGEVEDNKKVRIVVDKKGTYNILIFGDRKDETAMKDFNEYGIEYKNKK